MHGVPSLSIQPVEKLESLEKHSPCLTFKAQQWHHFNSLPSTKDQSQGTNPPNPPRGKQVGNVVCGWAAALHTDSVMDGAGVLVGTEPSL